jgi:hypothetical protein
MDALARAYATLELAAGACSAEAKKQYRLLVKRWHPDQFLGDPQGQAEAAIRMREINDAYRRITTHLAGGSPSADGPAAHEARAPNPTSYTPPIRPGQRLTREQIDRMVESMGTGGPVDWLLRWPFDLTRKMTNDSLMGDTAAVLRRSMLALGLTVVCCAVASLLALLSGVVHPLRDPAFLLNTAAISFILCLRVLARRSGE